MYMNYFLILLLVIIILHMYYLKEGFDIRNVTYCKNDYNNYVKFKKKKDKLVIHDYVDPTLNKRVYSTLEGNIIESNILLKEYENVHNTLDNKIIKTKNEEKKSYQTLNVLNNVNKEYQESILKNSIIENDFLLLN